jgi:hypothetical protein
MPGPEQLAKATLQMIQFDKSGTASATDNSGKATVAFPVQFNPQTLKVTFATQKAGGDQPKGSGVQFVGRGSTKLSLELWYDTTVEDTAGTGVPKDVREKTDEVNKLMRPTKAKPGKDENTFFPPGVRFQWGSFLFEGVMDSMDETLEFFSSTGVPLRASVSLSISRQDMKVERKESTAKEEPGTAMLGEAKKGQPLAKMTRKSNEVAAANGQENPRAVSPGTLLNMSPNAPPSASLGIGVSGSGSFGVSGGFDARASASLGGSASVGASASLRASGSLGGATSFAGAASLGGRAGGAFGGSAGVTGSASGRAGAGASPLGSSAGMVGIRLR